MNATVLRPAALVLCLSSAVPGLRARRCGDHDRRPDLHHEGVETAEVVYADRLHDAPPFLSLGNALSLLPYSIPDVLGGGPATIFLIVMAAAVLLLGPGAWSLDARLFGRREIVIP